MVNLILDGNVFIWKEKKATVLKITVTIIRVCTGITFGVSTVVNRKQQTNGGSFDFTVSGQSSKHVEYIFSFVNWRNYTRVSSIIVKINFGVSCKEACTLGDPLIYPFLCSFGLYSMPFV